jgi:hypothetical protein
MNTRSIATTAIALLMLGAVVYFGSQLAGKAARNVSI